MNKLLLIIGLSLFLVACNSEDDARELYNQALTEKRGGNLTLAIEQYKALIAEYPSSTAATEANKELGALETAENRTIEMTRNALKDMLFLYKIDNGRLPSTSQGLAALSGIDNIPTFRVEQFSYMENAGDYVLLHKND